MLRSSLALLSISKAVKIPVQENNEVCILLHAPSADPHFDPEPPSNTFARASARDLALSAPSQGSFSAATYSDCYSDSIWEGDPCWEQGWIPHDNCHRATADLVDWGIFLCHPVLFLFHF